MKITEELILGVDFFGEGATNSLGTNILEGERGDL